MSLNIAMNAAMTGLAASSRAIEVVSANVANAMTEGYAARRIMLSSSTVGGAGQGVKVVGVERQIDPVLMGLMRNAGGAAQQWGSQFTFWTNLERTIGLPGEQHSLQGKVATLDAAMIAAAGRPDQEHLLAGIVDSAGDLVRHLNQLEEHVQTARLNADSQIGRDVEMLNEGLERVSQLNRDIVKLQATGHSALGLIDERQSLIDSLSEIIPIKELRHADGRVALYTTGGQLLADTQTAKFEFYPSAVMDPTMSVGGGQLSGLLVNGLPIATNIEGPLGGGRLAGNFAIRDKEAPAAQAELDRMAADLIARFEAPGVDPTAVPGQPGLFTDQGNPLDLAATTGLAGRLSVNALVRTDLGGSPTQLRDGLGAVVPGPVGESAQLQRWIEAFQQPFPGPLGGTALSFGDMIGQSLSSLSQKRQTIEDRSNYATAYQAELSYHAKAMGVDVDGEMQRLMLIEKAYAANTRVLQIADEMMRQILEI